MLCFTKRRTIKCSFPVPQKKKKKKNGTKAKTEIAVFTFGDKGQNGVLCEMGGGSAKLCGASVAGRPKVLLTLNWVCLQTLVFVPEGKEFDPLVDCRLTGKIKMETRLQRKMCQEYSCCISGKCKFARWLCKPQGETLQQRNATKNTRSDKVIFKAVLGPFRAFIFACLSVVCFSPFLRRPLLSEVQKLHRILDQKWTIVEAIMAHQSEEKVRKWELACDNTATHPTSCDHFLLHEEVVFVSQWALIYHTKIPLKRRGNPEELPSPFLVGICLTQTSPIVCHFMLFPKV